MYRSYMQEVPVVYLSLYIKLFLLTFFVEKPWSFYISFLKSSLSFGIVLTMIPPRKGDSTMETS